ncbi:FAD dependent oxidoreductase [Mycena sp. CBHHK59/15]|nr:FAD dependent oxidoreductase [Mycena sp. CBHHK59/15]
MARNDRKALIVGSGCFGLSTALELLKRGWTDVTVIDRANTLPAPDGSSNDFNRKWKDTYHEYAIWRLCIGSPNCAVDYAHKSYLNEKEMGLRVVAFEDQTTMRQVFPSGVEAGSFSGKSGYLNRDGGWANAGQGVAILMSKVAALNGKIIGGKNASELIQHGQKTTGVRCSDGTVFEADLVVLATGSWTASAFPDVPVGKIFCATAQCIAMVQLTQEEGNIYRDCPVVLDFESGFYIFPPNEQNLVKMAVHAAGYTQSMGAKNISTPRTVTSDPETGLLIPKVNVKELRDGLRLVYPGLANKPFVATRLCWYNDSPDGDWVIGYHPLSEDSLMFATAGSGHAYKFLPKIGRLVVDAIEGKLMDRSPIKVDESRVGRVLQELDLSQLCTPEDLQ